MKCLICSKEIKFNDDKEAYGLDGDFVHKKCKPKINDIIDNIITMNDKDFYRYMKGEI